MSVGGMVIGKSHAEGGEKFIVESTGQLVELEGDEFVFRKSVLSETDILELEGTPKQILLQIAKKYNNPTGKLTKIVGGEFVICKNVIHDTEKIKVKGTVKEIINQLQSEKGCRVSNDSSPRFINKDGGYVIADLDKEKLKQWIGMELEHKSTFNKLRKNPEMSDKEIAQMIVLDHLNEDINYYEKDTFINPFKLLFGFNF